MSTLKKLEEFRELIYKKFIARSDANMNTVDALSSHGHQCKSVVELSEASCFERQYTSITDGIADGLAPHQFKLSEMAKFIVDLATSSADTAETRQRLLLVVDCTPNPRPSASTLEDRHITYAPNPAPGNKPICVGHEYSTVAMVPQDQPSREKHWLIPLSVQRVKCEEKGHEVGMDQIQTCIETLELTNQLIISLADSKYGSERCRKTVSKTPNWIHLFRLNSTRNVYSTDDNVLQKNGKKLKSTPRYGKKMTLNQPATHSEPAEAISTSMISGRGKPLTVSIKRWNNQCTRGSRTFKGYDHPMTIYQVSVMDEMGNARYKKPMWLAVTGARRGELSAQEVFEYYRFRYDIEHFFRFGKDKLLMASYQTPETTHEESWWNLTSAAYLQLYFARDAVPLLPKKWERYLPSYQHTENQEKKVATPSQVQRAFSLVLEEVGTPAKPCVPRGNPTGRKCGETQTQRIKHPVIFKTKSTAKLDKNSSIAGSEKQDKNSEPEKIKKLAKSVLTQLKNLNVEVGEFHKLLL